MFMEERKHQILDMLKKSKGSVTVKELCDRLYASGATIRRDLADLEKRKLIRRTHGGAMLSDDIIGGDPLIFREMHNYAQKQAIAKIAAGYVQDGMTLFLDSSTTVLAFAQTLRTFSNIRAVTNGLKTALLLADFPGVQVHCTGGALKDGFPSLVGMPAIEFIARHHADLCFLSCRGFSPELGATDSSEEEYYIKKQLMENSSRTVLLCDTSKFHTRFMCKLGPVSAFGAVITEDNGMNLRLSRLAKGL